MDKPYDDNDDDDVGLTDFKPGYWVGVQYDELVVMMMMIGFWTAVRMAGKCQTSAAHQTMKFVYSEAVNRALRQRCRGLAATTTDDELPPLPPEVLLAVLQSGDVDLSAVVGKSTAGRPPNDADAAPPPPPDNVDYEISNLAEIYREISRAVEQVRRRSAPGDASAVPSTDRPAVTRAAAAAASRTPTNSDDRTKTTAAVSSPRHPTHHVTGKDSNKRQKDERKVHFNVDAKQETTGEHR